MLLKMEVSFTVSLLFGSMFSNVSKFSMCIPKHTVYTPLKYLKLLFSEFLLQQKPAILYLTHS